MEVEEGNLSVLAWIGAERKKSCLETQNLGPVVALDVHYTCGPKVPKRRNYHVKPSSSYLWALGSHGAGEMLGLVTLHGLRFPPWREAAEPGGPE